MLNNKIKIILFFLNFIIISFLWKNEINAVYESCGTNGCEPELMENCVNCPTDCGSCSPAPSGGPGYCGDRICDPGLGEVCDSCISDCGVCAPPGWVECGIGTCSNGVKYKTMCTPSCLDPNQTCFNTPDCNWPPPNCTSPVAGYCAVLGGGGWCPCEEAGCPGGGGCGVIKCASGGNCWSDCTGCGASPSPGSSPPSSPSPPPICTPVAPAAPVLTSPANGSEIHTAMVTLDWADVTSWGKSCPVGAQQYRVYMDTNPAPNTKVCTTIPGTTLCQAPIAVNTIHYWKVCADNSFSVACSPIWSFTPTNVKPNPATGGSPQGNLTTNILSFQWLHDGFWGTNLGTPSQYFYVDYSTTPGSYNWASPQCTVSGAVGPLEYSCGSSFGPGSIPPITWGTTYYWKVRTSNNANDFTDTNTYIDSADPDWSFTPQHGPWFQVFGGDVYAGGVIISEIPQTSCSGICKPYFMPTLATQKHGVVAYNNTFSLGTDCGGSCIPSNISEDSDDWYVETNLNTTNYGYDWWLSHLANETKINLTSSNLGTIGADGVYTLDASISDLYGTLAANRKIIILANKANLSVSNNISVPPGSFLMVIVNGNLNVNSALGGSAAAPAVQGIFIASQIDFGTSNIPLFSAGTFIGWNGITLGRNLDDGGNNTAPATTFIYRPDFIINAPASVKKIYLPRWEQIPG